MWLKKVISNKESFKQIEFDATYNVIFADKVKDSSDKDTRNGLGKSMLLNIVNYCLGSGIPKKLEAPELKDWEFGIEVELAEKTYVVKRPVAAPNFVYIEGDVSEWPIEPEETDADEVHKYKVDDFTAMLGWIIFKLTPRPIDDLKYRPTFRSLMSYFTRTDAVAFSDPFRYFSMQPSWSIQLSNAYLLNLDWQEASRLQTFTKQKGALSKLRAASKEGLLDSFTGSVGELEAEEVRLKATLKDLSSRLATFKVHENYYDVQKEANELTERIHELLNRNSLDEQILSKYSENLSNEKDVDPKIIDDLYKEVGVSFNDTLLTQLEDVQKFHEEIIKNRRDYLEDEIERIKSSIQKSQEEIESLSTQRAELMTILESHGALEEYSTLQARASKIQQNVEEIRHRVERINEFDNKLSDVKVSIEELIKSLRRDHQQRKELITDAIEIFNQNSQFLYSEPGILAVDVSDSGYKYNVDIKRSGSDGISSMKVFCYDLTLAELWKKHRNSSIMLFHDSKIFDGVDARQIAKAFELAYTKSSVVGFQYICSINSDKVPQEDFNKEFAPKFQKAIKVRLTDKDESGKLLGVQF